jgi:transposase
LVKKASKRGAQGLLRERAGRDFLERSQRLGAKVATGEDDLGGFLRPRKAGANCAVDRHARESIPRLEGLFSAIFVERHRAVRVGAPGSVEVAHLAMADEIDPPARFDLSPQLLRHEGHL